MVKCHPVWTVKLGVDTVNSSDYHTTNFTYYYNSQYKVNKLTTECKNFFEISCYLPLTTAHEPTFNIKAKTLHK